MTAPEPSERDTSGPRSTAATDAGAVEELAARFRDRIRLFGARRLGDPAAAEDLAQDVLQRVAEALRAGRVENLDALPGFVFRTAHHLCLQRYRAAGREERAIGRLAGEAVGPEADPLTHLIGEERSRSVRRALDLLAAADRELLTLLYYQNVDARTAAHRLGISAEALRVRKHRALRRLAAQLGEAWEDVTE